MALGQCLQPLVGNQPDAARGQRDDVVVEPLQREAVEVREVARDLQLGELPLSAGEVLRARHPALEQQRRLVQLDAMADEGAVGGDFHDLRHEAANRFFFLGTDVVTDAKFSEMNLDHRRMSLSAAGRTAEAPHGC